MPREVTVQKICRVCKDEEDARRALDKIWDHPLKATAVLADILSENQYVFEFEKA